MTYDMQRSSGEVGRCTTLSDSNNVQLRCIRRGQGSSCNGTRLVSRGFTGYHRKMRTPTGRSAPARITLQESNEHVRKCSKTKDS